MNRETLNYISRRTNEERRSDDPYRQDGGEHNRMSESSNYPENRISERYERTNTYNKYGTSTNTYRAEGVIEGHIERHPHNEQRSEHSRHKVGFHSDHNEGDFIYALEETLESEIDDVVYYSELAMEAETKGHVEFANGFYEIAKEKLECAKCVRERLMKSGHYDPRKQSEIEDRFDRAKHLFKRL